MRTISGHNCDRRIIKYGTGYCSSAYEHHGREDETSSKEEQEKMKEV